MKPLPGAGWSSPVARQAHNLKVAGSNPAPATNQPIDLIALFPKIYILGKFLYIVTRGRSKFYLSFCCPIDGRIISRRISFNR
jgi:hypothetical protein